MKIIYTRVHIAKRYEIDPDTVRKWLHEIGITHRRALAPSELDAFDKRFGPPLRERQDPKR